MKKSLIALAILAASGAAMAQSSVTLYGIADIWVGSEKNELLDPDTGASTLGTKRVAKINSGGFNGSRFGFRGSEDLGGGLKAVFRLEQGFSMDTGVANTFETPAGATVSTAFNRQAFVGLEGGFGSVTFGNVWSATDDVIGAANGAFDSSFSPLYSMSGSVHSSYQDRPRNAIKYASPDFGGFTAAVVYGLDESAAVSEDVVDFNLAYAAGPVGASLAYQVQNGAPDDVNLTLLNGSYDLGVAKLLASFGQVKAGAAKSNTVQLGVDVPLSSALTLSGSFGQTRDNAANGDGKRDGFGIAAKYSLSKRTFTYAGLVSVNEKDGAGTKVGKLNLYAVGLQHSF